MTAWRVAYGVGLLVLVVLPLATPFAGILSAEAWTWTEDDVARRAYLGRNTLILTAAVVALALPSGTALAVLLFRTSFPGRRILLWALALVLFIPLPVVISSWQGLLGGVRPWASGLAPAIVIHALAALPWVAFIVGIGLKWVEPELEDEAALVVSPCRVLWLVTLPRVRGSIVTAALVVAMQTASEVAVTEMLQVATLAEETRTQFALADVGGLERTLALALPAFAAVWLVVLVIFAYLERRLPPAAPPARASRALEVGAPALRGVAAGLLLLAMLAPLGSLVWRLGLAGYPPQWGSDTASHFLRAGMRTMGNDLLATLGTSFVAGLLTAASALVACWLARDSRWFRWLLFGVLTWVWVLPGPVVGIGLHALIMRLPEGPWRTMLYVGPSPAPLIWVQVMRALPIAVLFLWPMVRMIPREWFEESRLGGAGALSELVHVVIPMAWRATLVTALAATALCLGEVAASGIVETPGWPSFTKILLDRIHYGVDNTLAALSLLMLASLAVLGLVTAGVMWICGKGQS